MSWVKLDDAFCDHPKIARVGAIGAWLQIQALCYCNRNLTDGFVPFGVAHSFLARGVIREDDRGALWTLGEHSGHQGLDLTDVDWPSQMVAAGIWKAVAGGFRIHDFDKYQPTKAEVLKDRRDHAIRQQNYMRRKADAISDGVTDAAPVPVPVPDSPVPDQNPEPPNPSLSFASLTLGEPPQDGFAEFWSAYPKKRHKPDARKAWKGADGDRRGAAILAGIERWRASEAWQRGFIEDPATFLRQRQWEDEPPAVQPADTMAQAAKELAKKRGWL